MSVLTALVYAFGIFPIVGGLISIGVVAATETYTRIVRIIRRRDR